MSGLLWTTIGERFQAVAIRGMSTEFVEFIRDPDNQPRMVASDLPIGRVVRGEPLVHVLDLMAGEVTHEPPAVQKLVELGGQHLRLPGTDYSSTSSQKSSERLVALNSHMINPDSARSIDAPISTQRGIRATVLSTYAVYSTTKFSQTFPTRRRVP